MLRAPFLLALALLAAGCVAPSQPLGGASADLPGAAGAVSAFNELLCEAVCNIRVTVESGPANEVALAMDPHHPLRLLGGGKDYNDRYTDCVTISWYLSEDGGKTWEEGYYREPRAAPLPHPPLGLGSLAAGQCQSGADSDPVPVFDGAGNAIMTTLSFDDADAQGSGIWIFSRAPGSGEWERLTNAFTGGTDKQWADMDPATGEVYVVTADFREDAEHDEELVKSADGGRTWEHVAWLDGIFGAQVAVRPGGLLTLIGLRFEPSAVVGLHSADGGATWTQVVDRPLAVDFGTRIAGLMDARPTDPAGSKLYRTPPLPVAAAAKGPSDRVALAYFDDAGDGDWEVFAQVSEDGGRTWGEPLRVGDDATGADQFMPAIAVGPRGDVHVMFMDARHDPTGEGRVLDVYYAHSADGRAWDPNLRITEESSVPYWGRHQIQPFFIGDYLGIAASDERAVMIWPDHRDERGDVFAAIVGGAPRP